MSNLAPDGMQQYFDNNGDPLAGGFVYTYIAGTTTPQVTYSDSTLTVPSQNTNPVQLDSSGRAAIWLGTGLSYKFVYADSTTAVIKTVDNIVNPSPATPYAVNIGGTGSATVVSAPTASSWAGWDANKNLSGNSLISGYQSIATAAGTTTLLVSSPLQNTFTGVTTQTVLLPVVSTLVLGQQYVFTNLSTGLVTIKSSGSNTLQAMAANTFLIATCTAITGTGTSSWSWNYSGLNLFISPWTNDLSFTVTGCGTVSNSSFFYKRIGDTMMCRADFTCGTNTAVTLSLGMPSGLTIDSTKIPSNASGSQVGLAFDVSSGTNALFSGSIGSVVFYDGSDTAKLYFGSTSNGSNAFTKAVATALWNTGDAVSIQFNVPITQWA